MQNWSCMHLWGHASIKFLWLCDTRAQDSFSLFKSTWCFQNMFYYQIMHSSKSILGVRENFHSIHPSGVYTSFFKNWLWSVKKFSKEKLEVISFQKCAGFLVKGIFFVCFFIIFLTACNLDTVDDRDHIFFFEKGVRMKVHNTYIFFRYFAT